MGAIFTPLAAPGLALSLLCHAIGAPALGWQAASGLGIGAQSSAVSAPASAPSHASLRPAIAQAAAVARSPRFVVRDFAQTTPHSTETLRTSAYAPRPAGSQPVFVMPSVVVVDPVPDEPAPVNDSPRQSDQGESAFGSAAKNAPASSAAPAAEPQSRPQAGGQRESASIAQQENELLALVNRERVSRGEQALTMSPLLCQVALAHSVDMCRRKYFDHVAPGPGPQSPMDRYLAAVPQRPDRAMLGENIYYRSVTDSISLYAAQAHDAFMHSPGHRANILTPQYDQCGIGIYQSQATGEYWVTEEFLTASP